MVEVKRPARAPQVQAEMRSDGSSRQHTWIRPLALSTWCVSGKEDRGSYLTLCRGRYPTNECETLPSPDHETRCHECQRQFIEVKRVERGLEELAGFGFDFGGEA